MEGQYYDYNKRNISVDICDTVNQVMMAAENFSTQRQFSISGNKYTINNM